jgi:hypothetical protein
MSKLARVLALGALLAATTLASTTAVAYADTEDAARRAALAQEHYYSTWGYGDPAVQQALAQERYYSTWGYGNTPAPVPAKPSRQPDWLVPGLGVLAATVALATGLAVLAAKRTRRKVRVGQEA